jgi:arylsulfatase A-like enzyme
VNEPAELSLALESDPALVPGSVRSRPQKTIPGTEQNEGLGDQGDRAEDRMKVSGSSDRTIQTGHDDARPTNDRRPAWAISMIVLGSSLVWAAWFGVVTGFVELGWLLLRNYQTGGVALGKLQMNRHFTWMVPVSNGIIFLTAGVALGVLSFICPRWTVRFRPHVLCFLAFLTLLLMAPGLLITAPIALAGGFAFVVGRRLSTHAEWFGRRVASSLPCFLVGLASLSAWVSSKDLLAEEWTRSRASVPDPRASNVLFVVMDTVRAASLSLHGYDRDTTPNLVRLAQRAVRFEQARSTAPWTLPSHASMFTGRWPHDLSVAETVPLDSTYPTLAEFLSRRGFATGGFVANAFFCNAWYGLGRGFEHYEDFHGDEVIITLAETLHCSRLGHGLLVMTGHPSLSNRRRKDAARINRDFLNWLDTENTRPFFAFLNYFDAHHPFVPPDGFNRRFGFGPISPKELTTLLEWDKRTRDKVSPQDAALAVSAYDDCISYIDQELGRLIDQLESRGVLDRTLVIITSDHGESMGEHGFFGHAKSLYNQEVHVPLLIIPPGGLTRGVSVREPVSLRELPATVAELLGAVRDSPFPGRSLARFWDSRPVPGSPFSGPVLSEVSLPTKLSQGLHGPPAWSGPMSSLVGGETAYICNADQSEELFDLYSDPAQLNNLVGSPEAPALLGRFRDQARAIRQQPYVPCKK